MLLLPEPAPAAEIRKGSGEMGKQERLHRKLGAGWEWLLFHFFSCVSGHNPPKPSCDTAPNPGQSPGLLATEHFTAHHGRHPGPGTPRATGTARVGQLSWGWDQMNWFCPWGGLPKSIVLFSSVQFSCSRMLHSQREIFQISAIFLSHSSCCLCTSQIPPSAVWRAETETNSARKGSSPT